MHIFGWLVSITKGVWTERVYFNKLVILTNTTWLTFFLGRCNVAFPGETKQIHHHVSSE